MQVSHHFGWCFQAKFQHSIQDMKFVVLSLNVLHWLPVFHIFSMQSSHSINSMFISTRTTNTVATLQRWGNVRKYCMHGWDCCWYTQKRSYGHLASRGFAAHARCISRLFLIILYYSYLFCITGPKYSKVCKNIDPPKNDETPQNRFVGSSSFWQDFWLPVKNTRNSYRVNTFFTESILCNIFLSWSFTL